MKKFLLLITLFISLAAQAYEPLIREGRVWVYDTLVQFPGMDSPGSSHVEFSGTTEINGVVYHNLIYSGNPDNVISLMREENKKVYRYIANDSYLWDMWNAYVDEAAQTEYNAKEGCHPGEILLYDFDRELGDSYMSLTCGDWSDKAVAPLAIVAKDPQVMLRDGLHPKPQLNVLYGDDFPNNNNITLYDGIGPVRGFLDTPGCGPWRASYNSWSYYLSQVYDKNTGKIIYNQADEGGYMPMVIPGLQWVYDKVTTDADGSKRITGSASYSFTSEIEKDGRKYLAFTDKATGENVAYMRQEGPAVYAWIDPEVAERPVAENGEVITENLLYNFSISSKFNSEMTEIWYVKYPIYTEAGEPITAFVNAKEYNKHIGPYSCDAQYVELSNGEERVGDAVFMEGVGPKTGRLFEPLAPIDGNNEKYELRQLTQGETVVYTRSQFESLFAGVEEINAEKSERDTRMYDLMGREIRNPQRGTIYIQNGEKRIAR